MTEKTFYGLTAAELQGVISTYELELREALSNQPLPPARRVAEMITLIDKLKFEYQELANDGWAPSADDPPEYHVTQVRSAS